MGTNIYVLIIAASVWIVIEGFLIFRDRAKAKGSTKIDRMSRAFNTMAISLAVYSPLLILVLPGLCFAGTKCLPARGSGPY